MVAVYRPNRREFAKFMKSTAIASVVRQVGEAGKAHAESISPVDTGEYQRKFRVDVRVIGDRQQGLLINEAAHATVVELHLRGGLRILGRAVDHMEQSL